MQHATTNSASGASSPPPSRARELPGAAPEAQALVRAICREHCFGRARGFWPGCRGLALLVFLFVLLATDAVCGGTEATNACAEATKAHQEFQSLYKADPGNATNGWMLARACFDLAEYSTNNTQRAELAEEGIAVCHHVLAQSSNSGPAHYYLALNLGQLARTRSLGALKLVDQMEQQLTSAIRLDPCLDNGGPDRSLGLLYRDAPALISIGSKVKAKKHLLAALELVPLCPENRLCLIESYLKWNDRNNARRESDTLEHDWSKAVAEFKGPAFAASWCDWELRLAEARKKLGEPSRLESPRH